MKANLLFSKCQSSWGQKNFLLPLVLVASLWTAVACSDEAKEWPNYRRDLVELHTDSHGKVAHLRLDNGKTYATDLKTQVLRPDTFYRMVATYVVKGEDRADIQQVEPVFAALPQLIVPAQHKDDPVQVLTFWRSPRYLNFRAKVGKSGVKTHYFTYNNRGITLNAAGIRTLYIDLYHNASGDTLHYEDEHLFSCPLYPYEAVLKAGRDSVVLRVRESGGLRRFAVLY